MKTRHSLLLVALTIAAAEPTVGNPQAPEKDNKKIEIRISPMTKVIKVGETLDVRAEVKNVGSKPLFIEGTIYELCAYSPLSLHLDLGPPLKSQVRWLCAADCVDEPKASFATRLVERWILLPVGNTYGAVLHLDPDSFPQLKTPGRWRLRGKYRSGGDLSSSICLSPVPLDPQQIEKLPYKAWQGEQDTNVAWIEVVGSGSSPKVKR
jgi:hypothetical protein